MYATLTKYLSRIFKKKTIFRYGFNISPMYRRSTGRIIEVSEDILSVKIRIPLSYKNSNYVGSIFGGSLFSATDPIYMVQLIHILGDKYVVWDKESTIKFKRPAKEAVYADFNFSPEEIDQIKKDVAQNNEIDIKKTLNITDQQGSSIIAEVSKIIYVADKTYFKNKRKKK
ncbi:DUF4442 domain-containing protein [Flavobacteriaceae bacterium S356]|uniref:DUF4442 domain-containing protein n=1 Tax=Asprobacillus argus TaxID=3076534 RepID=A0ABU3LEJ6_9FLAO|nr:DUF4442 domain-containing protein [Flavobacteriaceae bacterium S356]